MRERYLNAAENRKKNLRKQELVLFDFAQCLLSGKTMFYLNKKLKFLTSDNFLKKVTQMEFMDATQLDAIPKQKSPRRPLHIMQATLCISASASISISLILWMVA